MGVRFVIGRAGYGKSRFCLDEICSHLIAQPEGDPLIFIVPEQASFQAESAIMRHPQLRGSMRAEVLGFRRLAHRVMQQVQGTTRSYIDDSGKQMLLYKAVQQVADQLTFYRSKSISDGLLEQIGDLFDEWKRNGVEADALEEAAAGAGEQALAAKMSDLLLLYRVYEAELSKHYVDAEDDLVLLAKLVERSQHLRTATIWIDGFHGFTPLELQVVSQLAMHASQVTVTLCLDREYFGHEQPDELDLFFRTASTYRQLRELCSRFGVQIEPTVNLNAVTGPRRANKRALVHLERTFEMRPAVPFEATPEADEYSLPEDSLVLVEAVNRRVEVEAVAVELRRLVRERGLRWRDIAIMVRNLDDYAGHVRDIFKVYEIPHFSDQRRSVADHPLIEFVRASLQTIQRYWRYEDLFRAIKTGFFLPLHVESDDKRRKWQEAFDLLENAVIAAGLERSRWLHSKHWEQPMTLSGVRLQASQWKQICSARDAVLQPMQKLQKQLQNGSDVRAAVTAIYDYLCELHVPEKCARDGERMRTAGDLAGAQDNVRIWASIVKLLDQNVEILGDQPFRIGEWIRSFDNGLAALQLGFVPPSLDQVLLGSMDRTRLGDVKMLFLLGANEGVMPARVSERGLLSDRERDLLIAADVPLSPGSLRKLLDESFLLYTTMAACSDRLWVSYSLGSEAGKAMTASNTISHLKQMFPGLKARAIQLDYEKMDRAQLLETMEHPKQALEAWCANPLQRSYTERALEEWPTWSEKTNRLRQAARYRNQAKTLSADTAHALYGKQLKGSVSRFEQFSSCAFAHFAGYGLRLRARDRFELEAMHVGTLYHYVIEQVILQCQAQGMRLNDLSLEQLQQLVTDAVQRAAAELQHSILTSSPENQYTLEKLTRVVRQSMYGMMRHEANSEFEIKKLEWGFEHSRDSLLLRGRIDRLDVARDEQGRYWLRIIDFKSGNKKLELDRLYYGLSLQLLTYLDIAAETSEQWLGHPAEVAGAFYFHVHDKTNSLDHPPTSEQSYSSNRMKYKMNGLAFDDLGVIGMMDSDLKQPSTSSAVLPLRTVKDGSIHGQAQRYLLSGEQWTELRQFVRGKLAEIGAAVQAGRTEIEPYKWKQQTPCEYCEYKPVCQFDRHLPGQTYRRLHGLDREDVFERISNKTDNAT